MKASELRIGNYVSVMHSLPHQVTGYHLYMMENYVPKDPKEANYEEMTAPIPLTQEWLEKFGLSMDDDDPNYASWVKGAFNMEYATDDAGNKTLAFEVYSHYIPVLYVHQLQNLYFALTGTELYSSKVNFTQEKP